MSDQHTDRLELTEDKTLAGSTRFHIVWRNHNRKDLFLIQCHPMVPREAAESVLELLKQSGPLLRVLK